MASELHACSARSRAIWSHPDETGRRFFTSPANSWSSLSSRLSGGLQPALKNSPWSSVPSAATAAGKHARVVLGTARLQRPTHGSSKSAASGRARHQATSSGQPPIAAHNSASSSERASAARGASARAGLGRTERASSASGPRPNTALALALQLRQRWRVNRRASRRTTEARSETYYGHRHQSAA